MNKHVSGSAVWFTSALFDRTLRNTNPQPVENSVENPVISCGKADGKPLDSVGKTGNPTEGVRLRHGFSTRHGGVSTDPPLASLNFGFSVGEERGTTLENYRRFARTLGIGEGHTVCAFQTHSCTVLRAEASHRGLGLDPEVILPADRFPGGYDALVTDTPDVCLAIRTADCVPILFWDPVHRVIGAAHAGWRGTLGRIAENTVSAMEALGADRSTLLVSVGHAVGMCCYEIDDAFYARFLDAFGAEVCGQVFAKLPDSARPERFHCDLRALNAHILRACGIPEAHIEVSRLCTCCHPELFYSHRYAVQNQNGRRGLLAAMISMESNDSGES